MTKNKTLIMTKDIAEFLGYENLPSPEMDVDIESWSYVEKYLKKMDYDGMLVGAFPEIFETIGLFTFTLVANRVKKKEGYNSDHAVCDCLLTGIKMYLLIRGYVGLKKNNRGDMKIPSFKDIVYNEANL